MKNVTMKKHIDYAQEAMDLYKNGEVDEVNIVYTEFISPLTQESKIIKSITITFEEENKDTKEQAAKAKLEFNIYHQQKLY